MLLELISAYGRVAGGEHLPSSLADSERVCHRHKGLQDRQAASQKSSASGRRWIASISDVLVAFP
jgi:hypothetical protein